jgi:nicotinate-nucleotide adenylyltransferase
VRDVAGTEPGMAGGFPPPPATVVPGSIGVMGGTFDPIHLGHLAAAEEARELLGLARILFVPAGTPPHRPRPPVASAADRLAMVERAIAGNPCFEASRIEVEREGPSYTIDTIEQLVVSTPPGGGDERLDPTIILSLESFRGLHAWREPQRLLALARIAVVPRDGLEIPDRPALEARFPGRADRVTFLDGPRLEISSTAIRARIALGRSIRYLVPPAVLAWIEDHDLYRDGRPETA